MKEQLTRQLNSPAEGSRNDENVSPKKENYLNRTEECMVSQENINEVRNSHDKSHLKLHLEKGIFNEADKLGNSVEASTRTRQRAGS